MVYLSRDEILNADDREYEDVECPEWGGTVRLRSLSAAEFDGYQKSIIRQKGGNRTLNLENVRAKLVVLCAVDALGNALFGEADLAALGRKSSRPIDRLFEASQKLVGMSDEDVEELVEDFAPTQSED